MTYELYLDLYKCKDEITKRISKKHILHTFWCPKDKDGDHEKWGFTLYAYGGRVLDLHMINDRVHFSLFDSSYEKYFCDEWSKIEEKYNRIKMRDGGDEARLKRLFALSEKDWNIIFRAFNTRGYKKINGKQYLERDRETVISHINDGSIKGGMKIIEMESRMRGTNAKKKPDMIGVYKVGEKSVLNFIEYKCTTAAMDGTQAPIKHYEDMRGYFNKKDEFKYFEEYDKRIGQPLLEDTAKADRQMLFVFSHINDKEGMTTQKAINGLEKVKKQAEDDKKIEYVKVIILKNEEESIKINNIKSLEEAIKELKASKKK